MELTVFLKKKKVLKKFKKYRTWFVNESWIVFNIIYLLFQEPKK